MSAPEGTTALSNDASLQPSAGLKPHLVHMRGPLVVAHADSLRRELMRAIERHDAIVIDCAQATDADLSLVQLLISAERTASGSGKSIRIERSSPAVKNAFVAGGFPIGAIAGL